MSNIYNADYSINTGHHPNWNKGILKSNKKLVSYERVRLGLGRNKKPCPNRTSSSRAPVSSNNTLNQLAQFKKSNKEHKGTIAGLNTDTTANKSDDVDMENASYAFS